MAQKITQGKFLTLHTRDPANKIIFLVTFLSRNQLDGSRLTCSTHAFYGPCNKPLFSREASLACQVLINTDKVSTSIRNHLSTVLIFVIGIIVELLHNGHLGDRRKWPLWRGSRYGEVGVKNDKFI